VKGTVKAFRNLTNRMEEAAGDCVNLHLAYPALVYGFAHFLRGNREEEAEKPDDVAIRASGDIAPAILRYHDVMSRLTGRLQITEQPTSYEAVSLAIAQTGDRMGSLLPGFPHSDSALRYEVFWEHVCAAYDMRFVYSAPMLAGRTSRLAWTPDSPALEEARACGFIPRLAPGC